MRASEWRSTVETEGGRRREEGWRSEVGEETAREGVAEAGGLDKGEGVGEEGALRKSEILEGLGSNSRRGRGTEVWLGVVEGDPSVARMVWSERTEGFGLEGTLSPPRSGLD